MIPNDNIGRSIRHRLNNIAKQKNVPIQELITDFLIERMLVRIVSNKNLFNRLIFKGGYVAVKIFASGRYTRDLDAILEKGKMRETIELIKEAVSINLNDGVWFSYEKEIDLETQNEYGGTRLVFRTGIGQVLKDLKRAQQVNLDIGCGDPVTPAPLKIKTSSLLEGEDISWRVYPIETSVAEKLHAIVARQSFNSRAKDIFDLYMFLPKCDIAILKKAIKATFQYRGDPVPDSFSRLLKNIDTSILETGWKKAVAGIGNNISFKETYNEVIKLCTKIDEAT